MAVNNFYNILIDGIKTILLADPWISANIGTDAIYAYDKGNPRELFPCIEIALAQDIPDYDVQRYHHKPIIHLLPQQRILNKELLYKGDATTIGLYEITDYIMDCVTKKSNLKLADNCLQMILKGIYFNGGIFESELSGKSRFLAFSDIVLQVEKIRYMD